MADFNWPCYTLWDRTRKGAGFDGFVVRREGMGNGTLVVATLRAGDSRCPLLESGWETRRRNGTLGE